MKLVFLVVVAVAVLLPSFSEGRIVSKCELKDKLGKMLNLPRRLEESVLALIICEVDRISHLNTSLVNVLGKRVTTTLKPTVVTSPSTTAVTKMTTGATTLTNTNSTTTNLTNITTTTSSAIANTTVTTTSPAITNSTISSVNTTLVSNSTGSIKRRKRGADSSSEEEMGQIGRKMKDEDDSSEEDTDQNKKPLSLGFYGLFQLSDNDFCDSGYRPSRNVCRTSCNSFTDNNITDDIACFVNTGYWRNIMEHASRSCHHTINFFKECK